MKILRWGVVLSFTVAVALAVSFIGCHREDPKQPIASTKTFVVAIPTYPGFALPYLADKTGLFHYIKF